MTDLSQVRQCSHRVDFKSECVECEILWTESLLIVSEGNVVRFKAELAKLRGAEMSGISKYLCQMLGYNSEDEWTPIDASDAQEAARKFGERCDHHSGGELFQGLNDKHLVIVQNRGEYSKPENRTFSIGFDFSKCFYAHEKIAQK